MSDLVIAQGLASARSMAHGFLGAALAGAPAVPGSRAVGSLQESTSSHAGCAPSPAWQRTMAWAPGPALGEALGMPGCAAKAGNGAAALGQGRAHPPRGCQHSVGAAPWEPRAPGRLFLVSASPWPSSIPFPRPGEVRGGRGKAVSPFPAAGALHGATTSPPSLPPTGKQLPGALWAASASSRQIPCFSLWTNPSPRGSALLPRVLLELLPPCTPASRLRVPLADRAGKVVSLKANTCTWRFLSLSLSCPASLRFPAPPGPAAPLLQPSAWCWAWLQPCRGGNACAGESELPWLPERQQRGRRGEKKKKRLAFAASC